MRAGAAGGAPAGTRAARRSARYGIRWRARDMARLARFWMARQGFLGLLGAGWAAGFGAVLALFLIMPTAAPVPAWTYLEFGGLCCAGIILRQVARRGRR